MSKTIKLVDCVLAIAQHDCITHIIGQEGIVRACYPAFGEFAIEFDNDVHGHSLNFSYRCEHGHGWAIPPEKLVPSYLAPRKDTKIIIYTKGNKTFAKVIVGKRTVETECAVCSPEDTFSILTGAQIVLARLAHKNNAKHLISTADLHKSLMTSEFMEY